VAYALSAIEIAQWDIAGKLASLPIASLLGGAPRADRLRQLVALRGARVGHIGHRSRPGAGVSPPQAARSAFSPAAMGRVVAARTRAKQPSVIKFGGIEVVAQAAILARAHGVDYVPHCFYFGPGLLARFSSQRHSRPKSPSSSSSATWKSAPTTTRCALARGACRYRLDRGWGSIRTWR